MVFLDDLFILMANVTVVMWSYLKTIGFIISKKKKKKNDEETTKHNIEEKSSGFVSKVKRPNSALLLLEMDDTNTIVLCHNCTSEMTFQDVIACEAFAFFNLVG